MKEELTTEMHYEFLEDMGVDKKDYMIFAACGMMKRTGCSKEEACKRYGISVEEYDANIDRVLNSDDLFPETEFEKAKRLAAEAAKEYNEGYDIINYEGEYKGGLLFVSIKSKNLHKYAGFPLYILVKESKAERLEDNECWELFYYGIPS